jgi:hypothetical protein
MSENKRSRPLKAKNRRAKGDREELKTVLNEKDIFVKYNKKYEYDPDDLDDFDDERDESRTW